MSKDASTRPAEQIGRPAATLRAGLAAVVVALLATALTAAPAHAAAPAGEAFSDLPGAVDTDAGRFSAIDLAVPQGVTPRAVVGLLTIDSPAQGASLRLTVNGRQALTVPALDRQLVRVPLSAADVRADHTIALGVRYSLVARTARCSPPVTSHASLHDLRLAYSGRERPPTSVAGFFGPEVSRIIVVVPRAANDDQLGAALSAVGTLSGRYDLPTTLELVAAGSPLPNVSAGLRVVRIVAGPEKAVVSVSSPGGVPTLTLEGTGPGLPAAARALGSDELAMATSASTTSLSQTAPGRAADGGPVSLLDLGAPRVVLSGYGRSSAFIGIKQDRFGGPISSLHLHLRGTHTAVPTGSQAQLDTYVNDFLVDSRSLGREPLIDLDVTVPSSLLHADNGLQLVLTAVSSCTAGADRLPMEVDLDGGTSTIDAERGRGDLNALQLFPQVLGGDLPVALRPSGPDRVPAASLAASLITSLQRAAAAPLDIRLVDVTELVSGHHSGLLVGADYSDTVSLHAPLRIAAMRLLQDLGTQTETQVEVQEPFAVLQAAGQGDQHLILLGSWTPGSGYPSYVTLLNRLVQHTVSAGWAAASDDLVLATPGRPVFSLDLKYIVPQKSAVDEQRSFGLWFGVGAAVLLVALLGPVLLNSRRRRRIQELVSAQEAADSDPNRD